MALVSSNASSIVKDADGNVTELHCTLDPESRSGMPGADRKVKGTIHWVSAKHGVATEIRLYDRLFNVPTPDDESDGKSWIEHINPDAKRIVRGWLEPAAANAAPEQRYQFERLGYFVADRVDHRAEAPVFNRTVTLRDTWAKQALSARCYRCRSTSPCRPGSRTLPMRAVAMLPMRSALDWRSSCRATTSSTAAAARSVLRCSMSTAA